jgi:hypothetical protein
MTTNRPNNSADATPHPTPTAHNTADDRDLA